MGKFSLFQGRKKHIRSFSSYHVSQNLGNHSLPSQISYKKLLLYATSLVNFSFVTVCLLSLKTNRFCENPISKLKLNSVSGHHYQKSLPTILIQQQYSATA